jgi:integrase
LSGQDVHNLSIIATLKSVQGSLRERSPGVWQVRVSIGRDPKTKRYIYASSTIRGGRRAAQREAARLVKDASEGKIPLERETLAGLLERWLDHIEARGRAPKTLLENRRMAAVIAQELGAKELRKLRGRDLDTFYDDLRDRGLSPTSVRRYHAVLSASLNQAVKWGLVEHSPISQATPPSIERKEPSAPTPKQIKELIEAAQAKDPEFATLLFVAATTGCRRGELCGLQWSDLDLGSGYLVVRRSVSDLPGRIEVRTTKTGQVRRMALDEATTAILYAQRDLAESRCDAVGVTLRPEAFVWSQAADYSKPLKPGRITSRFSELRKGLGLRTVRLHHLRHFAATVMLAGGVDVRTVAGRLGHSRPTLTLQTYAHVMDVTDRRAASILGESIATVPITKDDE